MLFKEHVDVDIISRQSSLKEYLENNTILPVMEDFFLENTACPDVLDAYKNYYDS